MRKLLAITSNENGFYLPFVLFITTLMLAAATTSAMIYRNEVEITNHLLENIKAETLIQMSRVKFSEEKLHENNKDGKITYTFPSGLSEIRYESLEKGIILLEMKIITDKQIEFNYSNKLVFQSK